MGDVNELEHVLIDYRDTQRILGFLIRGEHKARFAQTKFKDHLLEYACVPLGHRGAFQFKGEPNRKKERKKKEKKKSITQSSSIGKE